MRDKNCNKDRPVGIRLTNFLSFLETGVRVIKRSESASSEIGLCKRRETAKQCAARNEPVNYKHAQHVTRYDQILDPIHSAAVNLIERRVNLSQPSTHKKAALQYTPQRTKHFSIDRLVAGAARGSNR